VPLPFQSSTLSKHAFEDYKTMFGLYLDIQKHLVLEQLPEDEVRGRWKSFVGKWYFPFHFTCVCIIGQSELHTQHPSVGIMKLTFVRNRGELAEGWYDPSTLQKAQASAASNPTIAEPRQRSRGSPTYESLLSAEESSGDDLVGPTLPGQDVAMRKGSMRAGPAIPNLQDLELKRGILPLRVGPLTQLIVLFVLELQQEDLQFHRQDLRHDRKLDRKQQKERLDEIMPRAEAGSKDRMLEKKREKANSDRAFASAKTEAGGVEEVPESDLLGGEDGGIEGFKKQKREMDRKKNERELRKEEILRARMEEREERIREYKAKEEKTMSGLVALAKARFG